MELTMDFKDLSAKFKKANPGPEAAQPKPMDFAESYRLRAKMLGVLVRDARVNGDRSLDDCARLLRVPVSEVEAWEFGDRVPSLPQLELLANYLGIPIAHFWGTDTFDNDKNSHAIDAQIQYLALRDRMIGALLRQAREESGLSVEALSETSNIPVEQLNRYELGEESLPMHELTVLASGVNKNISYFLESSSYIGQILSALQEWKHFTDLPDDIRQFAANPLNVGFIEIAIMLSKMPTDKLRQMGESMLEITM